MVDKDRQHCVIQTQIVAVGRELAYAQAAIEAVKAATGDMGCAALAANKEEKTAYLQLIENQMWETATQLEARIEALKAKRESLIAQDKALEA